MENYLIRNSSGNQMVTDASIRHHQELAQCHLYITSHAKWHFRSRVGNWSMSQILHRCYNAWIYGYDADRYQGELRDYLYNREIENGRVAQGTRILKIYGQALYVFADENDYVSLITVIKIPESFLSSDPTFRQDVAALEELARPEPKLTLGDFVSSEAKEWRAD